MEILDVVSKEVMKLPFTCSPNHHSHNILQLHSIGSMKIERVPLKKPKNQLHIYDGYEYGQNNSIIYRVPMFSFPYE
jgi:hypothetical protein